ncbi:MAG TPA: TRAM domain-containing protein [Candidatus Saccharimonadia bacterium]|nr:TRAM domain-containing protein [Candidatus Saccharimonadia bacterium]
MNYINTALFLIILVILIIKTDFKPKTKLQKSRSIILDTCALIDGRIVELSNSGFIPDNLIIPEFVIKELQFLADGSDSQKRSRARYGLDVVKDLQNSKNCNVIIDQSFSNVKLPTDDKLVKLSQKLDLPLYTTDFNLNKVAEISGVKVLNVNELAQQLRPEFLPGERQKIKIIQKGSNQSQGVGYLEDGTMVVIENASKYINKEVEIEIIRSLQTVAGRMLFAEIVR